MNPSNQPEPNQTQVNYPGNAAAHQRDIEGAKQIADSNKMVQPDAQAEPFGNSEELGLRDKAAGIAAKYFMATSNDCVALTKEIVALVEADKSAAVVEAAKWLLEQPSNIDGYTRNSNIQALIPTNWDMGGTPIGRLQPPTPKEHPNAN